MFVKKITGTMRGLGALEVSEHIKGAFIADEGLLLEDVGKLEKKRVVVYLIEDDPANVSYAPDPMADIDAEIAVLYDLYQRARTTKAALMEGEDVSTLTDAMPDPNGQLPITEEERGS